MTDPVLDLAADLLEEAEHRTLPLLRLHQLLVEELDRSVGGEERLRQRLERDPERFVVSPGMPPEWSGPAWPHAEREAYLAALDSAGVLAGPRVTLLATSPSRAEEPWAGALSASVAELLALARGNALLRTRSIDSPALSPRTG